MPLPSLPKFWPTLRRRAKFSRRLQKTAHPWERLYLEELESRLTPAGQQFVVNSLRDAVDNNLGDGVAWTGNLVNGQPEVTLRAAIMQANQTPDADTIVLPAGNFRLTLVGPGEDNAATGDLDIRQSLSLVGSNDGSPTVIDASALSARAFHIQTGPDGVVNLSALTISGGQASGDGGGILNQGALLGLHQVTLQGNTATGRGGGVFNQTGATASTRITESAILGNRAAVGGGFFNDGPAALFNSTISGNMAAVQGGGIVQASTANQRLSLTNVTMAENSAASGGNVFNQAGVMAVANSILAKPGAGGNVAGAPLTSVGYNIDTDGTAKFDFEGDRVIDPMLGPLQNNGGPTLTYEPLAGSPAIDAASPLFTLARDQRDVPRFFGLRGDIGAVEVGTPVVGVTTSLPSGTYTAGTVVDITVQFAGPVIVDTNGGAPTLVLNTNTRAQAVYQSGSGTNTLTFRYVAGPADDIGRLDYAWTTSLLLNGGRISDTRGEQALLPLPAPGSLASLSGTTNIVIDDDVRGPTVNVSGSIDTETDNLTQQFNWDVKAVDLDHVQVSITQNGVTIFNQPNAFATGSFNFDVRGLGTFTLTIDAFDNDNDHPGDQSVTHVTQTVVVTDDDIKPPVIVLGGSVDNEFDNQSQFFTWSVQDASGIDPQKFNVFVTKNGQKVSVPGAGNQSGTFNFDALGPGTYRITVNAADADQDWVGDKLQSPLATRAVTVRDDDTTGPTIVLSGSTSTETDGQTQQFDWDVSDDSGLNSVAVVISKLNLDGTSVTLWNSSAAGGSFNFDAFGLGTYSIAVSATDADADWVGDALINTATRTVTVTDDDVAPPTITLGGSTRTENDGQIQQFTWEVSDASGLDNVQVTVTRASDPANPVFTTGDPSGTFNFDDLGLDTYTIVVTADDGDADWQGDELTATKSRSVTVTDDDTTGPAITLTGSSGIQDDGKTQQFSWNVSDPSDLAEVEVFINQDGVGTIFFFQRRQRHLQFRRLRPGGVHHDRGRAGL